MNWLLDEGKEAGGFSLAFWLKSGGGILFGGGLLSGTGAIIWVG